MQNTDSVALARSLQAELIETHLSWVLLAGGSAWKIKKPVCFPFIDTTALPVRQHFCEEELRLNRRLAPSLYIGVVPIAGTPEAPVLNGPGQALEYAVQMRRFPQEALFSHQLEAASLSGADVDKLAALLADFHAHAERADLATDFASPERRRAAALAALEGASPVASPAEQAQLQNWLEAEAAALAPLWAQRQRGGCVRECHGDLHLDNLVSLDGGVAAFDGIEFDPAPRSCATCARTSAR